MKKLLTILFLLIFFSLTASADVLHEAKIDSEGMQVNTSVTLECSDNCPGLEWQVPKSAEVSSVKEVLPGRLEDAQYEVEGNILEVETSNKPWLSRDNTTIIISMNVKRASEEIYDGLYKREISFPGFNGKVTQGALVVDNLISGWKSYGFDTSYTNDTMKFRGEGPASLRVKFGEGEETKYYEFFGDYTGNTSQAYEISIGTIGVEQEFDRFPVASMPDEVYDTRANSWSAGEYIGGSMMIRSDLGDNYVPILAHETVHGLNDRELNWDRTSSAYFDEGTSEYVEAQVRKKLSAENGDVRPPGEIFGEDIRWDPDPRDNTYSLVPSRGDRDELWNYYRNDRDFMKEWSSRMAEHRSFGYAYSELVIRDYVANGGRLSDVYSGLQVSNKVTDPDVKWGVFSSQMDMTPCKYESRERFDSCLDRINEYDYPVYSAKPTKQKENLTVERLEIPENRFKGETGAVDSLKYDIQGLLDYFRELLKTVFSRI